MTVKGEDVGIDSGSEGATRLVDQLTAAHPDVACGPLRVSADVDGAVFNPQVADVGKSHAAQSIQCSATGQGDCAVAPGCRAIHGEGAAAIDIDGGGQFQGRVHPDGTVDGLGIGHPRGAASSDHGSVVVSEAGIREHQQAARRHIHRSRSIERARSPVEGKGASGEVDRSAIGDGAGKIRGPGACVGEGAFIDETPVIAAEVATETLCKGAAFFIGQGTVARERAARPICVAVEIHGAPDGECPRPRDGETAIGVGHARPGHLSIGPRHRSGHRESARAADRPAGLTESSGARIVVKSGGAALNQRGSRHGVGAASVEGGVAAIAEPDGRAGGGGQAARRGVRPLAAAGEMKGAGIYDDLPAVGQPDAEERLRRARTGGALDEGSLIDEGARIASGLRQRTIEVMGQRHSALDGQLGCPVEPDLSSRPSGVGSETDFMPEGSAGGRCQVLKSGAGKIRSAISLQDTAGTRERASRDGGPTDRRHRGRSA